MCRKLYSDSGFRFQGVKSPLTVSLLSSITTTPVAVITANSVPTFSAPTGLSLAGKLAMSKSDRDVSVFRGTHIGIHYQDHVDHLDPVFIPAIIFRVIFKPLLT